MNWPDYSFYFAGDSDIQMILPSQKRRLGAPDLAALPIGAYAPRNFMKDSHMTPEEAVQAFEDLDAKQAVAVHWGTFKLTSEPLAEPPKRLRAELARRGFAADRFRALSHGTKTAALALQKFPKGLGSVRPFGPFCSGRHAQTRP